MSNTPRKINVILLNIKINGPKLVKVCADINWRQPGKISPKYTQPEWKYWKKFKDRGLLIWLTLYRVLIKKTQQEAPLPRRAQRVRRA